MSKDLLISAAGLITSMTTALILVFFEANGFALYSLSLWLIVPVGAILSGFVAASGYYGGAILFHRRPKAIVLYNMVAISVCTYIVFNYINFRNMSYMDASISEYVTFGQYMHVAITSASMSLGYRGSSVGSTGELGGMGYLVALLQVAGFACGGFFVYRRLASKPYCNNCSKYYAKYDIISKFIDPCQHRLSLSLFRRNKMSPFHRFGVVLREPVSRGLISTCSLWFHEVCSTSAWFAYK